MNIRTGRSTASRKKEGLSRYTSGNWATQLSNGKEIKVKDTSKLIPVIIDRRTTLYIDPTDKNKIEEIKKKYEHVKLPV